MIPIIVVETTIMVLENSGFSGANKPPKASGRLYKNPINKPCNDQCIFNALIPMVKPISVRLAIICNDTAKGNSPELHANPKQTNPNANPARVAIIILFILVVFWFIISNLIKNITPK